MCARKKSGGPEGLALTIKPDRHWARNLSSPGSEIINLFQANVYFLHPLKTLENEVDAFRG